MIVSLAQNNILFKTHFSDEYDLAQIFKNIFESTSVSNDPIDFSAMGLIKKETTDIWHIDVPIGFCTDEAVPCFINGGYIGANHGCNAAVSITLENHGKTYADIGSVWQDEVGVKFTLMRVMDCNTLHFLSDNIGESTARYNFVKKITGTLTHIENAQNTSPIINTENQCVTDLKRAIRHKKREVVAFNDGVGRIVSSYAECDYAQMREEYEIINPATLAQDLIKRRPKDGYTSAQDLGYYGEPMFIYSVIYQIDSTGALTIEFDHKKLMDIHFEKWMGAMYQEKMDVYGGSIARFIPKTLPFSTNEGEFDFSRGVMLRGGAFPDNHMLTKDEWINDVYTPDRLVDYFRDADGNDKLSLACGYIPVFDGVPEIRSQNSHCIHIYKTRKAYPTFLNGDLSDIHGVAYKKFFIPDNNNASVYDIKYDGKTYIYMDFHHSASLSYEYCGSISVFEKSSNISYSAENGLLTVNSSSDGFAVFICE